MINLVKTINDMQLSLTPHSNSRSLAEHLIRVGQSLTTTEETVDVVAAGYFHSIYGRQFTTFKQPVSHLDRHLIRQAIGDDAEALCYLNCAMNHNSFWHTLNFKFGDEYFIFDRFENKKCSVRLDQLIKLLRINFANMIDHFEPAAAKDFKWGELSLYLQHYESLSRMQQHIFDRTFNLRNGL